MEVFLQKSGVLRAQVVIGKEGDVLLSRAYSWSEGPAMSPNPKTYSCWPALAGCFAEPPSNLLSTKESSPEQLDHGTTPPRTLEHILVPASRSAHRRHHGRRPTQPPCRLESKCKPRRAGVGLGMHDISDVLTDPTHHQRVCVLSKRCPS